jgi:hypothetical protein
MFGDFKRKKIFEEDKKEPSSITEPLLGGEKKFKLYQSCVVL